MLSGLSASRLIVRSFVGVWRRWRHREKGALDQGWIKRTATSAEAPDAGGDPAAALVRGGRDGNMQPWARSFYKSRAWQKCREAYIAYRHGLCERCGAGGKVVHHKVYLTPDNI